MQKCCQVAPDALGSQVHTLNAQLLLWQVGFGSGFKCNSAVWKALRNVDSKHAAWKHLAADTSTEQDSKLRVENNTAAESKGTTDKPTVQPTLRNGQNRASVDSEDVSDKENSICNGHQDMTQGGTANVKDREGDVCAAGESNLAESKSCLNGQIMHKESGSGEIKAHSQPLNGKQAAAFL